MIVASSLDGDGGAVNEVEVDRVLQLGFRKVSHYSGSIWGKPGAHPDEDHDDPLGVEDGESASEDERKLRMKLL